MDGIRHATLEDAGRIAALMTALGYPTESAAMRVRLGKILADEAYATFVAEDREQVIAVLGICLQHHYARHGSSGRIVALSVHEGQRGRGLGRALVRQAERWVAGHGGRRVIVNTHVRRADAHAFYRALGYEETGLRFVREL